jgi:F0F1-type ATP synthase membrane subunit b/b'
MTTTITIPAALSKAAEVLILRQLSAAIGPQSYIGPWLADVANDVEADIANDLSPSPTPAQAREMQHEARQTLAAAHTQAERITAIAYAQAEQIRGAARQSAAALSARAVSQVRAALRELES